MEHADDSRWTETQAGSEEQMREYCQDWETTPVPWQNVVMGVEQVTSCALRPIWPTEAELQALNGTMIRWDDGLVAIILKRGLSNVDQNATIVKESMHPLIDGTEDMSPDADANIEQVFKSEVFGIGKGEADHTPVVQSEHLALIAAACVLVPARRRDAIRNEMAAGKTYIQVAKDLGVPEQYVSIAMSPTVVEYTRQAAEASITA